MASPPRPATCGRVPAPWRAGWLRGALHPAGYRLEGTSVAVDGGAVWTVDYEITVDRELGTRAARITGRSASGRHELLIEGDGSGGWRVDGVVRDELNGCMDVDLEASAFTNTLPVRRLPLAIGEESDAPAVYVRAEDLLVERLEQHYTRIEGSGQNTRYDYSSPRFDYADVLVYDESGLIVDYPGLATRAA